MSSENDRKVVRVSAESDKTVRAFAKARKIQVGEAADQLISSGYRRLEALAKYNAKPKKETNGKAKKAPRKKKAEAIQDDASVN